MYPVHHADDYYSYHHRQILLARQRQSLEHELQSLQDHNRRVTRKARRQNIFKQAQQIEQMITQIQTRRAAQFIPEDSYPVREETQRSVTPPTATDSVNDSSSIRHLLTKVMQQNDELHCMLYHQQCVVRDNQCGPTPTQPRQTKEHGVRVATPVIPSNESRSPTEPSKKNINVEERNEAKVTAKQSPWSVLSDLPAVEWTEQDEQLLDTLVSGEEGDDILSLPGPLSSTKLPSVDSTMTTDATLAARMEKKKQQEERQESRKKLSLMFQSTLENGSSLRRPRWRIDADIDNGVVTPFAGGVGEQSMPPRQIFRSAVIAVMALLEVQGLVLQKKLRHKEKAIRDFEAMLNVYFDATRVWLGKLVKTPLLSIMQEPSLDLDISFKTGLLQASKGLSKKFEALLSLRSSTAAGHPKSFDHSKMIKLKVRVKGVIDSLVKALERGDVPPGIIEFWKRLTSDGVYFPQCYELFPAERQILELDSLGATQGGSSGTGHSRFQVTLMNFLVLRTLVPHVILRPWDVGLGCPTGSKTVLANLKNVATLLYIICAELSPLPPLGGDDVSSRGLSRRRSVEAPSTQVPGSNNSLEAAEMKQQEDHHGKRFFSIQEIHAMLYPDKVFPKRHEHLLAFIEEQKHRLHGTMLALQARLHPLPNPEGSSL